MILLYSLVLSVIAPPSFASTPKNSELKWEAELMAREAKRTFPAKDLSVGDPVRKELVKQAENTLKKATNRKPHEMQFWMARSFRSEEDGATYYFLTGQVKRETEEKTWVADRTAILYKKSPTGKLHALKTLIGFNDAPYDCFFLGSQKVGVPALPAQLFGYAGQGQYHEQHTKRCMDQVRAENDMGGFVNTDPNMFADMQ